MGKLLRVHTEQEDEVQSKALAGWLLLNYFYTWLCWQLSAPLLPFSQSAPMVAVGLDWAPWIFNRLCLYLLTLPLWLALLELFFRPLGKFTRVALAVQGMLLWLHCVSDQRLWNPNSCLLLLANLAFWLGTVRLRQAVSFYVLAGSVTMLDPAWLSGQALQAQLGLPVGSQILALLVVGGCAGGAVGWGFPGKWAWRILLGTLLFLWLAWGLSATSGAQRPDSNVLLCLGLVWLLGPLPSPPGGRAVFPPGGGRWDAGALAGVFLFLAPCSLWENCPGVTAVFRVASGPEVLEITCQRRPRRGWSRLGRHHFSTRVWHGQTVERQVDNVQGPIVWRGLRVFDTRLVSEAPGRQLTSAGVGDGWAARLTREHPQLQVSSEFSP